MARIHSTNEASNVTKMFVLSILSASIFFLLQMSKLMLFPASIVSIHPTIKSYIVASVFFVVFSPLSFLLCLMFAHKFECFVHFCKLCLTKRVSLLATYLWHVSNWKRLRGVRANRLMGLVDMLERESCAGVVGLIKLMAGLVPFGLVCVMSYVPHTGQLSYATFSISQIPNTKYSVPFHQSCLPQSITSHYILSILSMFLKTCNLYCFHSLLFLFFACFAWTRI